VISFRLNISLYKLRIHWYHSVGSSHVSISMDNTQFGMIGFSQMVDGVCFAMTSAALTVNFIGKGVVWCNFYLFCIFFCQVIYCCRWHHLITRFGGVPPPASLIEVFRPSVEDLSGDPPLPESCLSLRHIITWSKCISSAPLRTLDKAVGEL